MPADASFADFHLDETRAGSRQRFLEQLKGIIIIEHLDGVRQCKQLLLAGLDNNLELASLGSAVCLHVCQEFLVVQQLLLRVSQIIFHLYNLHRQSTHTPSNAATNTSTANPSTNAS